MSELATVQHYPDAACHKPWIDPDLFHEGDEDEAKMICNGEGAIGPCPARARCLADAEEAEKHKPDQHLFGVFGGLSATERMASRRGHIPVEPVRVGARNKAWRGSSTERRRRKEWLLENTSMDLGLERTRCFQCKTELVFETLRAVRINPDAGFFRDNIMPGCSFCATQRSSVLQRQRKDAAS